jgi:hypothetical protein
MAKAATSIQTVTSASSNRSLLKGWPGGLLRVNLGHGIVEGRDLVEELRP